MYAVRCCVFIAKIIQPLIISHLIIILFSRSFILLKMKSIKVKSHTSRRVFLCSPLRAFDSFFNSSSHFVAHPVNANFLIRCLWTYLLLFFQLLYILNLLISHVSSVCKIYHRLSAKFNIAFRIFNSILIGRRRSEIKESKLY